MLQRSRLSCEGHLALVPAVTRRASPSWYCGLLVRGKGSKTIGHSLKLASDQQQEEEEARPLLPFRPDVQGVREKRRQSHFGRRGHSRDCLQHHLQRRPLFSCHEESWASHPSAWPSLQQRSFLSLAHGWPATRSALPCPGTSRAVQGSPCLHFPKVLGRENSLPPGLCCRKESLRPLLGITHPARSNSLPRPRGRNQPASRLQGGGTYRSQFQKQQPQMPPSPGREQFPARGEGGAPIWLVV